MTRVFVSSVSVGLESVRQQIAADLAKAGFEPRGMEQFGAQDQPPIETCLRSLRLAEAVVLLVGPRYGSLLPQGISYTHAEFREARERGIPVLAFVVPPADNLDPKEKERLDNFLAEVGSVSTYDRLDKSESRDRLSPKILAALSTAKARGDLGTKYSIFQPFDRVFALQLSDPSTLFNHLSPYIGRGTQLTRLVDFLKGTEPLLILKAAGGSGKSRLLLEAARLAAADKGLPKVLFVDTGAQWSAADIALLPITPTVLVFDDAHRRPDLDRLIAACRQQNADTRFIVSCRPSAVGVVTPLITPLLSSGSAPELDLPQLSTADAVTLAESLLGPELAHLGERLVRLADSNPLVICVGARCIAQKLVQPEVLERTPDEFRTIVLDRLMGDPSLQGPNQLPVRLLEVLAGIGPVNSESDPLVETIATFLNMQPFDVRRELSHLEKAGFVARRGRLVRVTPDVLADHLLHRSSLDLQGRPTGFVEALISAFSPDYLENILANAAELDWRAAVTPGHTSVLTTTWRELLSSLPTLTNSARQQLVKQLRRAAIFAPQEVLQLCEWLVDHPEAPPNEQLKTWGLEDKPDQVREALIEMFGFIGTHPDYTATCLSRLWPLAAADERPTNPHPGHPKRQIEGLLKYERRTDWRTPDGVHAKTTAFLIDRLLDPRRVEPAEWAIPVLGSALSRLGEQNSATRRAFTLGQFSLAKFYGDIEARRNAVIDCLRALALGARPTESVAAIGELAELLSAPRGPFGKELSPEEIEAWLPEARRSLDVLVEVASAAQSEAVRYSARRAARQVRRDGWPNIQKPVEDALAKCKAVSDEGLFDLLLGLPWEEQEESWEDEEKRVEQLCVTAARTLWEVHKEPQRVVRAVVDGIQALRTLTQRGESHSGKVMRFVFDQHPDQGAALLGALVEAGPDAWPLLRPVVLSLHKREPEAAFKWVSHFADDGAPELRAYALDALQYMLDDLQDVEAPLSLLRHLAHDPSPMVRRLVPAPLRALRKRHATSALEVLADIDWNNDLSVAASVLDVLDPRYGLDPKDLTDEQIDRFLSLIKTLPSLEGGHRDVLEFVTRAAARRPEQTVRMLLERVRAVDEHSGERGEDRWRPLPYNGHGLSLAGIQSFDRYQDLLRAVRDASADASVMVNFWLPTLFAAVAGSPEAAIPVLRESAQSRDAEKVISAAHLLRGFDREVVFSHHAYVAELLTSAAAVSDECLRHVRSELFAVAISGVQMGAPGQPGPRDVHDKSVGVQLAEAYAAQPAAQQFFLDLAASAEDSIRRHMQEWEEEGGDE